MYAMFALVFLALYVALREADQGRMAIAITFSLLAACRRGNSVGFPPTTFCTICQ
jgi:hypothetical protein